jgi:hypothetical protein
MHRVPQSSAGTLESVVRVGEPTLPSKRRQLMRSGTPPGGEIASRGGRGASRRRFRSRARGCPPAENRSPARRCVPTCRLSMLDRVGRSAILRQGEKRPKIGRFGAPGARVQGGDLERMGMQGHFGRAEQAGQDTREPSAVGHHSHELRSGDARRGGRDPALACEPRRIRTTSSTIGVFEISRVRSSLTSRGRPPRLHEQPPGRGMRLAGYPADPAGAVRSEPYSRGLSEEME